MHPLFVDLVLHRVACFAGALPKAGPMGFIRGYASVLELVSKGVRKLFHPRLRLAVHCAGVAGDGLWRAHHNYKAMPHEQWRREHDNGKVRWILTPVLWGSAYDSSDCGSDYDSEDQSYAFRGRMVRYMCDY